MYDDIVLKLQKEHRLSAAEYKELLVNPVYDSALQEAARRQALEIFGNEIYIRGLIEFTNYCKNNCYYCGIRAGNKNVERYRLTKDDILLCCKHGYELGFRTFVLQGGEDKLFTEEILCDIVSAIRKEFPDCAITLSFGELPRSMYQSLFDSGANRYLLRHETANPIHYSKLHPENLSHENRIKCLYDLKEIGYQVGCGLMVGSPYQTGDNLVEDLMFIGDFKPHMVGIGPFIPHKDTPFAHYSAGSVQMTLKLLSIIRLMEPRVLLPSTTALASLMPDGCEQGILAGANVVMPNLSPDIAKSKYILYNNKSSVGAQDANALLVLRQRLNKIGYTISNSRGDYN